MGWQYRPVNCLNWVSESPYKLEQRLYPIIQWAVRNPETILHVLEDDEVEPKTMVLLTENQMMLMFLPANEAIELEVARARGR